MASRNGIAMASPFVVPKYTGLHAFRHFFASWCINRKEDDGNGGNKGGLELPPKVVQERMGHASIQMTLDRPILASSLSAIRSWSGSGR